MASDNGADALLLGMRIMAAGGSALDAVEACARQVEADQREHSVGRGSRRGTMFYCHSAPVISMGSM